MSAYAIINTQTGKYVWGTDYRYHPPQQRTSDSRVLIFGSQIEADQARLVRRCGKKYKTCAVEIKLLKVFDNSDNP